MALASNTSGQALAVSELGTVVREVVDTTPVVDMHTHLFAPSYGALALWGVDDLLTYHYLEAELFRVSPVTPDQYWSLTKKQRADLVWRAMFVERTPISESARGVVATLTALGIDPSSDTLTPIREFFARQDPGQHVTRVFRAAGVSHVVMTNDPLDPEESTTRSSAGGDDRFHASLRLDRILNEWEDHIDSLREQGFTVNRAVDDCTIAEVRRFLTTWAERLRPVYMGASLPDSFAFPADDPRTELLTRAVLPVCAELRLPLALMVGVKRQVNPALRLAGDGAGRADVGAVARLCVAHPGNRFLISLLSRENQHELCIYARKFSNLLPFGCWWFLNSSSIVEEITRERIEMLGTSFIPQHSDARVLEHLLYKWRDTRRLLAAILERSYQHLIADGGTVTRSHLERDVARLFRGNFEQWTGRTFPMR
jgi:hypothetical protein